MKGYYHIFADNWNQIEENERQAYHAFREACKRFDNVRLYLLSDDDDGGECLEAKGTFPL
jgi:hypothetical protein